MEASGSHKDILFVEDNSADVTLLQHAVLEYGKLPWRIYRVRDGQAALAFLRQEGLFADMPHPALVILDIHLPKLNGWEVLETIRATPALATIPVVMLTGIMARHDEEQRAVLRPTACVEKPVKLEEYAQLVQTIEQLIP
jgi:two-component system, chemotaxis family, response regulator Rcp1